MILPALLHINFDHADLSDAEITNLCHGYYEGQQIKQQYIRGIGSKVVIISEDAVVKYGSRVTAEEAGNLRTAYSLLDQTIVRVPRIFRFFRNLTGGREPPMGYLVMERIHGESLTTLDDAQLNRVVHILGHFSTVQSQTPGPLVQGGVSHGLLWEAGGEGKPTLIENWDNGCPILETVQDMEGSLNQRIVNDEYKLSLTGLPLSLCHLDLGLRNMVWGTDGSVCLLGWATAGFYPRFFEVFLLTLMQLEHKHESSYENKLLDRIDKLPTQEGIQMARLQRSGIINPKLWYVVWPVDRNNTDNIQMILDVMGGVETTRSLVDQSVLFWRISVTKAQARDIRDHPQVN